VTSTGAYGDVCFAFLLVLLQQAAVGAVN